MNIKDFNNKQFDIFGTIFTIKLVDTLDEEDKLLHYGITECTQIMAQIKIDDKTAASYR